MLRRGVVLVLVLCFAHTASAYWEDPMGDHAWETWINWEPDLTADFTRADTAPFIGYNGDDICNVTQAGNVVGKVDIDPSSANSTLTVKNGASLAVDGSIHLVNILTGKVSTLIIDVGGTLNVGEKVVGTVGDMKLGRASRLGDAHMYVNGTLNCLSSDPVNYPTELQVGTWSAGSYAGSDAHLYIGATGIVNANTISINTEPLDCDAFIDIATSGQIFIDGDVRTQMTIYRNLGLILGDGIPGNVAFMYDSENDKTMIQVPEPMTIALLGLGGLLLRKRR